MLHYVQDDIFLNRSDTIILHGCNTLGKMGAGIAKSVKEKFPSCYRTYLEELPNKKLGEVIWWKDKSFTMGNCLTQSAISRTRKVANYEAILSCLCDAAQYSLDHKIHEIRSTKIGCNLAGGDWNIVEQIFINVSNEFGVDFHIYTL